MKSLALPKVSVVIATRDRLELLRKAVAAAVDQDYSGEIEVVVVFDQSEPVNDLISHSPGRSVRVVTNSRTPGLAGARNSGIMASTGDLVAFCDDDDWWLKEKLRLQVDAMMPAGIVAAVSGIEIHYEDVVHTRTPPVNQISAADLSASRMTGAHPSTYVIERRVLVDGAGLVDEMLPYGYGEDYDLLLRLVQYGTIVVVREPLVVVLWHRGSYFSRRWEAMAGGLSYLLDKHPELRRNRSGHAWIEGQRAFALAAMGQRRAALRAARRSLRLNPREARGVLALLVASGVLSPARVMHALNSRGRGI